MLTLNEKSYLTQFLGKYIKGQDEKLYELAERINYAERGKLLALCYQSQKDPLYVDKLIEVVQDMQDLKGIK